VRLSNARAHDNGQVLVKRGSTVPPLACRLGTPDMASVLIIDNDHAGAFGFKHEKYEVAESDG